jgi:hypothetical protein
VFEMALPETVAHLYFIQARYQHADKARFFYRIFYGIL